MRTRFFPVTVSSIAFGLGLAMLLPLSSLHGQIRSYDANFATNAPTIDGVIGANEWDAASDGGGAWTLIRTPDGGAPDVENNRFKALWNQDGFYLLGESDYGSWAEDVNGQNPAASDFTGDFLNVFLDPNTLDEENGQLDVEIDNYQIGFNVYPDSLSCGGDRVAGTADDCTFETDPPLALNGVNVTGSTFGTLTAAHVDGLFNNDSEWEHLRGTHISYEANANGAVMEMFIPWEEFDALVETTGTGEETGLHHPFAPSEDDVWFFNVTRQSSDENNFLSQWNWTSSDFFASHGNGADEQGHGELRFVGGGNVGVTGDFNGDGTLTVADIDLLTAEIGAASNNADFDLTADGIVDNADRETWIKDVRKTWIGDSNLDGEFNSADFVSVFQVGEYEDGVDANSDWSDGDWNGDSEFDSSDFVSAFQDGGFELGPRANANAVPEPSSAILLLLGLISICRIRRP